MNKKTRILVRLKNDLHFLIQRLAAEQGCSLSNMIQRYIAQAKSEAMNFKDLSPSVSLNYLSCERHKKQLWFALLSAQLLESLVEHVLPNGQEKIEQVKDKVEKKLSEFDLLLEDKLIGLSIVLTQEQRVWLDECSQQQNVSRNQIIHTILHKYIRVKAQKKLDHSSLEDKIFFQTTYIHVLLCKLVESLKEAQEFKRYAYHRASALTSKIFNKTVEEMGCLDVIEL
jgi:hypothetical protein